ALSAIRDRLEVTIKVLADDFIFNFRPFALALEERINLINAGAVFSQRCHFPVGILSESGKEAGVFCLIIKKGSGDKITGRRRVVVAASPPATWPCGSPYRNEGCRRRENGLPRT